MSERTPSFVIKFADILLPFTKEADRRIELRLVELLANTSFEINDFKSAIKTPCWLQRYLVKNDKSGYERWWMF